MIFILLKKLFLVSKELYLLRLTFLVSRASGGMKTRVKRETRKLNFYPIPEQPAITKFGRFVTSTQSSSHSFATETGVPYL